MGRSGRWNGLQRLTLALTVTGIMALSLPSMVEAAPQAAVIIVDGDTGHVILSENPDAQTYPASLTKMMTLYLTFEALESGRFTLDQQIPVSALAASQEPTKLGLRAGTMVSVRDAMMGLITVSANDAAVALAEANAGSEDAFARKMTAKARDLGMSGTVFRNANGLPDPDQHTTARDMTKLGMALKRDFPKYFPYFLTQVWRYRGVPLRNHNRLLGKYNGVTGIKTGYIRASGFNQVVTVSRNGRNLVGAIFGGPSAAGRDERMMNYLDQAFVKLERQPQLVAQAQVVRPNVVGRSPSPSLPAANVAQQTNDSTSSGLTIVADYPTDERPGMPRQPYPQPQPYAQPMPVSGGKDSEALSAKIAEVDRSAIEGDDDGAPVANAPMQVAALPASNRPAPANPPRPAPANPSVARPDPSGLGNQLAVRNAGGGTGESWGIQIGAFRQEDAAKDHLVTALKTAPKFLKAAQMAVHQGSDGNSMVYRARFIGMTESEARDACLILKKKDLTCIAVKIPATVVSLR